MVHLVEDMLIQVKNAELVDNLMDRHMQQPDMFEHCSIPLLVFDEDMTRCARWELAKNDRGYMFSAEGRLEEAAELSGLGYFDELVRKGLAFYESDHVRAHSTHYRLPPGPMADEMVAVSVHWESRDELSEDQASKIIEGGTGEVEEEIWEACEGQYLRNNPADLLEDYIDKYEQFFKLDSHDLYKMYDNDELSDDELRVEIYGRYGLWELLCLDVGLSELAAHTDFPAVLSMMSNYDCVGSYHGEGGAYSYEESYFGDMLDFLNMNPALMKEELGKAGMDALGEFPDKPERNRSEAADYRELLIELLNTTSGGNTLTFMSRYPLEEYVKQGGMVPGKIIIPSGTPYTLFSSFYGGGGACKATTKKSITVDMQGRILHMRPDTSRYGPKAVYGCGNEMYGDSFTVSEWILRG